MVGPGHLARLYSNDRNCQSSLVPCVRRPSTYASKEQHFQAVELFLVLLVVLSTSMVVGLSSFVRNRILFWNVLVLIKNPTQLTKLLVWINSSTGVSYDNPTSILVMCWTWLNKWHIKIALHHQNRPAPVVRCRAIFGLALVSYLHQSFIGVRIDQDWLERFPRMHWLTPGFRVYGLRFRVLPKPSPVLSHRSYSLRSITSSRCLTHSHITFHLHSSSEGGCQVLS